MITAALAGAGLAASILCPTAFGLSRLAWNRGVRRGYLNARSRFDQEVQETVAIILAKGFATGTRFPER